MFIRRATMDSSLSMLDELQKRMNFLFNELEPQYHMQSFPHLATENWPLVNMFDEGDHLLIVAQVPGIAEKNITVTVHQEVLTISGKRHTTAPEGYSVHRRERGAIEFSRSFSMPCKVDLEKTSASLNNGLLTVNLGKAEEAKPKQIAVKVS